MVEESPIEKQVIWISNENICSDMFYCSVENKCFLGK